MEWRKIKAIGITTVMVAVLLTGCGKNETNTQENVDQNYNVQSDNNTKDQTTNQQSEAIIAQVTEVNKNMVTATVGQLSSGNFGGGQMPGGNAPDGQMPGGNVPDGQMPGGNAPDGPMPDGNAPDGPMPDGNAPDGPMPGGKGSEFVASDDTISFTITDDTSITVEFLQGSSEGTVEDIVVNAVLEITLDDNSNATAITIKNLNVGGGFGGSGEVTNGSYANLIQEDSTVTDTSYTSNGDDENALRIEQATVNLNGVKVDKSGGESSNTEDGDFYGQNAALLAVNGATVNIDNASISSNAINGNGVFSYGTGTTVNISNSNIRTTLNNSGGIQTTGGGTTNAFNLDVETQGNSSAAIRSDRGGGIVNVNEGSYVTNGTGSPAIYCTADISVCDATLTANSSESVVVEGKNSVSLKNCTLMGAMDNTYNGDSNENIHCIMIYQSMSGDASIGEASFEAEGGSITSLVGDMFYVTNTDCEINLSQVEFTLANDTFLRVEGNNSTRGWGTQGANGGDVILTTTNQVINGNILVDSISSLKLTMKENSTFTGAINPEGDAGTVDVTIDADSTWTLTKDSYITSLTGDIDNINTNGYHLYINQEQVK